MGVLVDFLQHQHARLALELERLAVGDVGGRAHGVVDQRPQEDGATVSGVFISAKIRRIRQIRGLLQSWT